MDKWPGIPRGLGNEDEGPEKEVLETAAAEWQRAIAAIGRGPVAATAYLPLSAGRGFWGEASAPLSCTAAPPRPLNPSGLAERPSTFRGIKRK